MIRDGARDGLPWRKSSRSDPSDTGCVSIARTGRAVAIRDSTDPAGPVITLPARALRDLIAAVKRGELDLRGDGAHTAIG